MKISNKNIAVIRTLIGVAQDKSKTDMVHYLEGYEQALKDYKGYTYKEECTDGCISTLVNKIRKVVKRGRNKDMGRSDKTVSGSTTRE